jgi:ribosomal protein S11
LCTKSSVEKGISQFSKIKCHFNKKQAINYLFCIESCSLFSNKFLYVFIHFFFFSRTWATTRKLFSYRRSVGKEYFKLKVKKEYRRVNKAKKRLYKYNKGILSITFTKRNMFLNLANYNNKSLLVTSLRKLGFLGRRRREYTSILTATRLVKQTFRKYRIRFLIVIYKGWNRFRVAARNTIKYRDKYRVPTLFIKFAIKVPHNGCRLSQKKKKKRKKKVWLRRKIKHRKRI